MAYVILFAVTLVAAFLGGIVASRTVLAELKKAELAAQADLEKYLADLKKAL